MALLLREHFVSPITFSEMSTLTGSLIGSFLLCALVLRISRRNHQRLPLPPSPPADPLIGHLRIFPDARDMAEVFHEWTQKYGMNISSIG